MDALDVDPEAPCALWLESMDGVREESLGPTGTVWEHAKGVGSQLSRLASLALFRKEPVR
jgi:hypothetical protein